MFMERLLREIQRLGDLFSLIELTSRASSSETMMAGQSPRAILQIVAICARIAELGDSIAKAGHRECEKDLLDQITREAREVLYNVNAGLSMVR